MTLCTLRVSLWAWDTLRRMAHGLPRRGPEGVGLFLQLPASLLD